MITAAANCGCYIEGTSCKVWMLITGIFLALLIIGVLIKR